MQTVTAPGERARPWWAAAALSLCLAGAAGGEVRRVPSAEDHQETLADPSRWALVWADEFEGDTIDADRWALVDGGGGFGNNELQHYTPRATNAQVRGGCLVVQALKEDYRQHAYTSAKLHTSGRASWTYGRFEIRAKLPYGQGIWPAIWMMPDRHDAHGGWPVCGEIDIMEMVGHAPGTVYGTLHYGNPWRNAGGPYTLPEDRTFADDFHTFTLEWGPGVFRWYVDGTLSHTETEWYTSEPDARWPAPFSKPFYLQLNLAVGGNWPGVPDATTAFPQRMHVDYVRVYRYLGTYPEVEDRPAVRQPAPAREPLPDGNLVYNGSFDDGEAHWTLLLQEGGRAALSAEDGKLAIERSDPGRQVYSIQLVQGPLPFTKDARYAVTFEARADAPTDIQVNAGKASQHWDSYSGKRTLQLGTEKAEHALDFRMWATTDNEARLEFNLGGADTSRVYLDNVRVALLETGAPLVLGSELLLEGEAYDAASGVGTEPCNEGGRNVGWWEPGDWTDFEVQVSTAGTYRVDMRYAAMQPGARMDVLAGLGDVTACDFPETGDWQNWATASVEVALPAGPQTLRLRCAAPGFNINWIRLTRLGGSP